MTLLIAGCSAQDAAAKESTTPSTEPDTEVSTTQEEENMKTQIQFIRNATMKIEYTGKTFLTDPMLSDKETLPGFLNPNAMANPTADLPVETATLLEGVESIFLSHTHIPAEEVPTPPSDHFDPVAIEIIQKDMPLYVQPHDEAGMKRLGYTDLTVINDELEVDGIKVTRFEGRHVDLDPLLPMIGENSGYVFEAEGAPTILWTGDTLLTDDVKDAISAFNPDIIIAHAGGAQLPIDAEGNKATLLMNADSIVEIAKLAPQAKIVAIHLESLDHCPVTREEVRSKADEAGISEDRILIPADGETLVF